MAKLSEMKLGETKLGELEKKPTTLTLTVEKV